METVVINPLTSLAAAKIDGAFWRGKRVFVTGHTGFKGSWLCQWLVRLGAEVSGAALAPQRETDLFVAAAVAQTMDNRLVDIRDRSAICAAVRDLRPQIVFHLAAQSLVRDSFRSPAETFDTNVMGSVNLLDALREGSDVRAVVMVTTDKVYENQEWPFPYREDDGLGGLDPYAASKAACELVASSYRRSFLAAQGVGVATARAGNVIGGGDWANDRLIPDAIRAWSRSETLAIRNAQAIRPWQHVLDPLHAYMLLAERLWDDPTLAQAFNIGPDTAEQLSVRDVVEQARRVFGEGRTDFDAGDADQLHETSRLTLGTAKARLLLGVHSRWGASKAIERTVLWYRRSVTEPAAALCAEDIGAYETAR